MKFSIKTKLKRLTALVQVTAPFCCPKSQQVLPDTLTPENWKEQGYLTQLEWWRVSAFFFSAQFQTHLCVLLWSKWIFSSRIPHSRVCVFTRSFQCVVGRQTTLQTDLWFSSGFCLLPLLQAKTMQMKVWSVTKWLTAVAWTAEVCHISPAGW